MRIFDPNGERLYLTRKERNRFLESSVILDAVSRMYCHLLAYTGCRSTEALQLTMDRINFEESEITIKTLKQHKTDSKGRVKHPRYRVIDVPRSFIEDLDLVFGIREIQKKGKDKEVLLFAKCRTTLYRKVKDVMSHAGIEGKMATCKGLRHAFAISMLTAEKPVPLHIVSVLLGHTSVDTTMIYTQATGDERKVMVENAWKSQ